MKRFTLFALLVLPGYLLPGRVAAQAPPGWAWLKAINGQTNMSSEANSCADLGRDAAGNLYVAGSFVGTASFDTNVQALSSGENDVYVAKYSASGALQWLRTMQGSGKDQALSLAVDAAGNTVVAGLYGGYNGDSLVIPGGQVLQGPRGYGAPERNGIYGSFAFLAAFDAQGTARWATRVSPTYAVSAAYGGPHTLALGPQGEVYWSAAMQEAMIVGSQTYARIGSEQDAFLVKYSATGQLLRFRQVGAGSSVSGGGVQTDAAGAVYWQIVHLGQTISVPTSSSTSLQSNQNQTLVKIDANNAVKWLRPGWPTTGPNTQQNNLLIGSDAASGSLFAAVETAQSRTLSFAGSAGAITLPAGQIGTVLVRSDTSGQVTWAKLIGTTSDTRARPPRVVSAAADASGSIVLTASLYNFAYQLPAPQAFTADGGLQAVLKYSPATDAFAWIRPFGIAPAGNPGLNATLANAVVDPTGNVYLAGSFTGTARFGPLSTSSASTSRPDGFLAKLDQTVLPVRQPQRSQPWAVFPNPAATQAWATGLPPRTTLHLLDCLGRRVRTLQSGTATEPLNLRGLPPGVYLVQPADNCFAPYRLLVQ